MELQITRQKVPKKEERKTKTSVFLGSSNNCILFRPDILELCEDEDRRIHH